MQYVHSRPSGIEILGVKEFMRIKETNVIFVPTYQGNKYVNQNLKAKMIEMFHTFIIAKMWI